MVENRWYAILTSAEVPRSGPLGVVRLGEHLVLWRDAAGVLQAVSDRCPHRGAAMSAGRVVDGCIECPFHGFRFDGAGACVALPAHGTGANARPIPPNLRAPAFHVREAQDFVWLWSGDGEPGPLPWFDELDDSYTWHGFHDDWATHYTRAVENQLDFTHLPFAHRTTIGSSPRLRGRLDVVTEIEGDRMKVSYDPATYDGGGFYVELLAPNLWRNRLAPGAFALIAFTPIDATHTRLYLRFYAKKRGIPGLAWAACWVSNLFNRYILWQDKRIVLTQLPLETKLGMPERLVPSDRPILEWRQWRERNLKR